MARVIPNEALDLILQNIGVTSGGSTLANTFLALFTTFTASTIGTSVSAADSYTEPTGGAYARCTIAAGSWGAIGNTTSGRLSTCAQISFVQATGPYSAAVNGFWIANQASATADKVYLGASNFDDGLSVTIATSDQIKVTPSFIAASA